MSFILSVLGVLLIVEGIPYFAFPRKTRQWALLLGDIPDKTMRVVGLVAMIAGLVLVYAARSLLF